jgi:hypothetical protein
MIALARSTGAPCLTGPDELWLARKGICKVHWTAAQAYEQVCYAEPAPA